MWLSDETQILPYYHPPLHWLPTTCCASASVHYTSPVASHIASSKGHDSAQATTMKCHQPILQECMRLANLLIIIIIKLILLVITIIINFNCISATVNQAADALEHLIKLIRPLALNDQ